MRRLSDSASDITLPDAVSTFLAYCKSKNLSGRTVEYYNQRLRSFMRFVADTCSEEMPLESVDSALIREFLARECERNSPTTANHSLTSIKAFYAYAERESLVEANPAIRLEKQKTKQTVIETFSQDEIAALLATCRKDWYGVRDRAIIVLLLDCGLRVSELPGIKLEDIDMADQTIKVLGKGNKERRVPFGQGARQALSMWLAKRGKLSSPYLVVNHYGEPVLRWRIRDMIYDRGKKAGIKGVRCSPHTLRHTCAISYLRAGGDVFSLQRLLGHSSLEMTRRYCSTLSSMDVSAKHRQFSPVDNLPQAAVGTKRQRLS